MQGLLFYDAGAGEGEFYKVNIIGEIGLLNGITGWRSTWTQIIPGNFGGSGFTDLLFCDAGAGTGEFYTTDGQGRITQISQHADWRSTWTQIIPGNFGGSGFTDLLFYDAGAGTGEFYTTDGQGRITQISQHADWRSTWTQIIPGNFGGSGFTDLLFYDAGAGTGEFYTTDGQGRITQISQHADWRSTWTQIIPGNFGGSGFTDLLFYDAGAGTGEFYTTDGQGGITQLTQQPHLSSNADVIIRGSWLSGSSSDLLFYSPAARRGLFYKAYGGLLRQMKVHVDWRPSWTLIIPGDFGGTNFTNLGAPSDLRILNVKDRAIHLAWTNPPDSDGSRIKFRGTRDSFTDHTGSMSVAHDINDALLGGLRSGYEYTISAVSLNAAGESTASNEVKAVTPSRSIDVSKEGSGHTAVFSVSGSGFTPGSLANIRIGDAPFNFGDFQETIKLDGKLVWKQGVPCVSGKLLTFTVFETEDPDGTVANSVETMCP